MSNPSVSTPRQEKPAALSSTTSGPSREARRRAAVILEVLGGARTPTQAAEALGLSLIRYYQLETRALQGLVSACEPKPLGRVISPQTQLTALRKEQERLKRELARQQALVRLSQRAVGLTRRLRRVCLVQARPSPSDPPRQEDPTMRGRKPVGPEAVEQLTGSEQAKQRLRVILETLAGTRRVQEACAALEIGEVRFNQLRLDVLSAGLAALEARPKGRPPRLARAVDAAEVEALRQRLEQSDAERKAAQVREEIALARLPVPREARAAEKKRHDSHRGGSGGGVDRASESGGRTPAAGAATRAAVFASGAGQARGLACLGMPGPAGGGGGQ
jgi:hypothetical protein